MENTKPCICCKKPLESVHGPEDTYAPYGGGTVTLQFSYGSCKFDDAVGYTQMTGVICDDCAEQLAGGMAIAHFGLYGEPTVPWNERE